MTPEVNTSQILDAISGLKEDFRERLDKVESKIDKMEVDVRSLEQKVASKDDVAKAKSDMEKKQEDHELRIRDVEKWKERATGIMLVVGFFSSAVGGGIVYLLTAAVKAKP